MKPKYKIQKRVDKSGTVWYDVYRKTFFGWKKLDFWYSEARAREHLNALTAPLAVKYYDKAGYELVR